MEWLAQQLAPGLIYPTAGAVLFALGLYGLIRRHHLVLRILALNIMGSGVFMVLLGIAARGEGPPDPVAQALTLTGIVVAVSATAFALALVVRLARITGQAMMLPGPPDDDAPVDDISREEHAPSAEYERERCE
ncbi:MULTISPECIES: NADH-quinone oxidoreductase subunit K [unclassified Thioalkalivibrio]|uniref:NADH-quinone oxidoreductase subunit K n=1 Tax=unclassified Thioalkalivibrio TaxID=2621013 RepID=UPI00037D6EA4|nr:MULTISPECIES: NADH-quinone oxidoreductase subunit K [unclassified Thioalkalivibrio]